MTDNLTYDKLRKMIDDIYDALPILYYGTSEAVALGKVLMMKETDYTHEAIIVHPDDLASIQRKLRACCRLVHLREAPPKFPQEVRL